VFAGQIAVGILIAVVMFIRSRPSVSSPDDVPRVIGEIFARPPMFLTLAGASVLVTFAGGVVPALFSPVPFTRRLAIHRTRTRWWQDVLLVFGCVAVSWFLAALVSLLHLDRQGVLADFEKALRGLRGPLLAVAILIIGVIGPVAEELLFRGYVQSRLRRRWGVVPAVIIASVLFGLLHFDLVHSTFAFGLGLALGYATERSGSIWPAVWAHAVNNTISVLVSASGLSQAADVSGAKILIPVTAGVAVVCILLVERKRPVPRAAAIEETHGTT
jgi:membrane protease YdiL (CAAX protease family)